MRRDADLIVVGGGVVGLYSALVARERWSRWRIVVLERTAVGAGASSRAPGIQLRFGRDERERTQARAGLQAWRSRFSAWDWRPGREWPLMWLTRHPDVIRRGALEAVHVEAVCDGRDIPVRFGTDEYCVHDTLDRDEVGPIVTRLAEDLRLAGVSVQEGAEVEALRVERTGRLAVVAGGVVWRARRVVVATGPWQAAMDSRLAGALGRPVRVKKVVAVHVAVREANAAVAVGLPDEKAFLVPLEAHGQWLLSFTSDCWDVSPEAADLTLSVRERRQAAGILDGRFGDESWQIVGERVFCDAYAVQGGAAAQHGALAPGIVVAGAGGGNGFRFAPHVAAQATDLCA